MTTQAIADRLVAMCRAGQYVEAINDLYAPEVRQSENGVEQTLARDAVAAACRAWLDSRVLHGSEVLGLHVAPDSIVLELRYDQTPHGTHERQQWCEAAVYRIANGAIANIRFYYKPAGT